MGRIWTKHNNRPKIEEMVPQTILAFKHRKVEEVFQQHSQEIALGPSHF